MLSLRNSGLKSLEKELHPADAQPEEERASGWHDRDAQSYLQALPSLPAASCPAFSSFVGFPSKLSRTLSAFIRCDLEKKSVGHDLKTGPERTAKGGLTVYLAKMGTATGISASRCV